MSTIQTEIKTYLIEMICDKCLEGKMLFDNATKYSFFNIYGPYDHKWDKCEVQEKYDRIYPFEQRRTII